jgi:hypothetical protein
MRKDSVRLCIFMENAPGSVLIENAQRLSVKHSIYFCQNTHGLIHNYLKQHMAITVEASTILGSPYSSGTHYQWYV